MRSVTRSLCVTSLSLLLAGAALAADSPKPEAPAAGPAKVPAWQQKCAADIDKHCKEAAKTGGVPECLAAHEKDLSEECSDGFLARYKIAQLCKGDIEKLCKQVVASGGSLGQCFKDHQKDLSEPCRKAITQGSKKHQAEQKAEQKAAARAEKKKTAEK